MEALNSNPCASGRGVHEELSRLHSQNDDDLADVLLDPFSLRRIEIHDLEVDILEVVAR
jgi:flagellar assembly factor FliW